jgi:plastocyanin
VLPYGDRALKETWVTKETIALLLVAGLAVAALAACSGIGIAETAGVQPASPPPVPRAPSDEMTDGPGGNGGQVIRGAEVFVSMQDPGGSGEYIYDPDEFSFAVGDIITFVLESESEFHTFTVSDLDINVSVQSGMTADTTFTFDTAGTYDLICVPHQALGMVGTITVQ